MVSNIFGIYRKNSGELNEWIKKYPNYGSLETQSGSIRTKDNTVGGRGVISLHAFLASMAQYYQKISALWQQNKMSANT